MPDLSLDLPPPGIPRNPDDLIARARQAAPGELLWAEFFKLHDQLQERFREIEEALGLTSSGGGTVTTSVDGPQALLFSRAGILGKENDTTPRLALPQKRTVSKLLVYLKQAPSGGNLIVRVRTLLGSAATDLATITLNDGALTGNLANPGSLPAEAQVLVDVLGVGLTFPGRDLSVILRLA